MFRNMFLFQPARLYGERFNVTDEGHIVTEFQPTRPRQTARAQAGLIVDALDASFGAYWN